MLSDEQFSRIAPKLRFVQIAATVMLFVVGVLIPVMCQIANWQFLTESPKMLTLIAAFASLMMFTMAFVVPRAFSGTLTASQTGDQAEDRAGYKALDSAMGMFTTETFIQLVLLEGAAFVNLVVYSVEFHLASLVLVGIAVLSMLICFPRKSKAGSVINKKLGT